MRRMPLALACAVALVLPAQASAVTARQATNRIGTCIKHKAHALRIEKLDHGQTGMAHFRGYYRWVSYAPWVSDGRVFATMTISAGLTRKEKRAVNGCLRPYHGRV
jgi:hypothetical protein